MCRQSIQHVVRLQPAWVMERFLHGVIQNMAVTQVEYKINFRMFRRFGQTGVLLLPSWVMEQLLHGAIHILAVTAVTSRIASNM